MRRHTQRKVLTYGVVIAADGLYKRDVFSKSWASAHETRPQADDEQDSRIPSQLRPSVANKPGLRVSSKRPSTPTGMRALICTSEHRRRLLETPTDSSTGELRKRAY